MEEQPLAYRDDATRPSGGSRPRRGPWIGIGIFALLLVAGLVIAGEVMIRQAAPILKGRITETLAARFHSRVELDNLNVSVLRGLEVSGGGLRIYARDPVVAAGASQPIIGLSKFSFYSGLIGLFVRPMHVGTVHATGLVISIPPGGMRDQSQDRTATHEGKVQMIVDEIVCDESKVIIDAANPGKDPKVFELRHIELHHVGPDEPWRYDATLTNAIPRGEIHATGTFGPWRAEEPGSSPVTGHYTFDHAALNTIKGIGGVLSSVGDFKGRLDRIVVDGTTETPDFSLDVANYRMPLHTQFHAIVDGTTGDTYLQPVNARLRNSSFTTSGTVINIKGQGHEIALDVDVPNGQVQDFLDLAVTTKPAVMTGSIQTHTKLLIRAGPESVTKKLGFQGSFTLGNIHFSNARVQEQVNMFSLRAQGDPQDARPGAKQVSSLMRGTFSMEHGVIHFSNLAYALPGAGVNLEGVYSLDGQRFDFHGKVRTTAALSEMVDSRLLSGLLKLVNPFFRRNGAGAEIPVRISGTRSDVQFGLDLFR